MVKEKLTGITTLVCSGCPEGITGWLEYWFRVFWLYLKAAL